MTRSDTKPGDKNLFLGFSAVIATLVLSGCGYLGSSGGLSELDENPRPEREEIVQEPSEEQIREAIGEESWSCNYDPSMNRDWHDDVVCRNGFESFRPTLLPELGFVTEDQMIAAGEAYESQLNR